MSDNNNNARRIRRRRRSPVARGRRSWELWVLALLILLLGLFAVGRLTGLVSPSPPDEVVSQQIRDQASHMLDHAAAASTIDTALERVRELKQENALLILNPVSAEKREAISGQLDAAITDLYRWKDRAPHSSAWVSVYLSYLSAVQENLPPVRKPIDTILYEYWLIIILIPVALMLLRKLFWLIDWIFQLGQTAPPQ